MFIFENKLFTLKHIFLALLTGLLCWFAWPTYGVVFFLFVAFVPLLWVEFQLRQTSKSKRTIFGLAYLSFVVWNAGTTSWLYFSDPFGMFFAVLVNSLLMSLVFLLYHIVAKRLPFTASATFFISSWICFEYIHLHWEFSWPWLNLGNAFSENTSIIQWYEYTGTFGGTLWVLVANVIVFKALLLFQQYKEKRILLAASLRFTLWIGIPIGISYFIGSQWIPSQRYMEVISLQPNIDPYTEKYHTDDAAMQRKLLQLLDTVISPTTDLVLLPETVFAQGTRLKNYELSAAHAFAKEVIAVYPNTRILGGISAYDIVADSLATSQSNRHPNGFWYNDYNAAFFETNQQPPSFYYKSKLVVGVENFPYQGVLKPLLGDVMLDMGGTVAMKTTQDERSVFVIKDDIKVAPIICYESVYGEFVTGYVQNGASLLAIMTNDAWWGNTQGHRQHWSYAKLRAIETRRAIARSANTGISGYIDADGSVLKNTNYNEEASVSMQLPLYSSLTFYVNAGDYIARIAQFLTLFIFLFAIIKFKRVGIKR